MFLEKLKRRRRKRQKSNLTNLCYRDYHMTVIHKRPSSFSFLSAPFPSLKPVLKIHTLLIKGTSLLRHILSDRLERSHLLAPLFNKQNLSIKDLKLHYYCIELKKQGLFSVHPITVLT